MKKQRTIVAVFVMVIAGMIGWFVGGFFNNPSVSILFALIAGIACVVYTLDNQEQ